MRWWSLTSRVHAPSSPAAHCCTSVQSALAPSAHVRTRRGFTEGPAAMVAPGGTCTPFPLDPTRSERFPDGKINPVKRILALAAAVALLAVAGVLLEQRVERDRQYQDLLASGDQHLASGDTATAIEAFSGALALRPSSMVAHLRRGEAYRADRQVDDAVRDLLEAARLAPDSTAPALSLRDLYDA